MPDVRYNPVWVTQIRHPPSTDPKEIEADWAAGCKFRVYRFQVDVDRSRCLDLMMAGFTHVKIVYQRPDLKAESLTLELAKFKDR